MIFLTRVFFITLIGLLSINAISAEKTLKSDVTLDCGSNGSKQVSTANIDTQHSAYMRVGQTIWVASNVLVEYQPSSSIYSKELVETYLMCGYEAEPKTVRDYSQVQSRSGVNHWKIHGTGSRVATTHFAKAVYTAEQEGWHTCWIEYACSPKSGDSVTFKKNESYLTYHAVDKYPGANFIPDGDHLVDSIETHTPGGSKIWDAGYSTKNKSEVLVYWSPRLTNCEEGDAQCGSSFEGYDADTYYDWRMVVYQYNGSVVCNKDFGNWDEQNVCKHNDHHCDFKTYRDEFPIVTGYGSEGYCGDNTARRKFKAYTQIRKSDDIYSDIMVHNSASGRSNFMIYAR